MAARSGLFLAILVLYAACARFNSFYENRPNGRGSYEIGKSCRSPEIDLTVFLLARTDGRKPDLWNSDAVLAIVVKRLEGIHGVSPPIRILWRDTRPRDPTSGRVISRTFTDFPNVLRDRNLEPESDDEREARIRNEYREFVKNIVSDPPLNLKNLAKVFSAIHINYQTLVERCIYGY